MWELYVVAVCSSRNSHLTGDFSESKSRQDFCSSGIYVLQLVRGRAIVVVDVVVCDSSITEIQ